MSTRELLNALEAHDAEVVAILTPLYAEVRHWEWELAQTRKAKRTISDSDTHPQDGDVKQAPLVSGAGPQDIAQAPEKEA